MVSVIFLTIDDNVNSFGNMMGIIKHGFAVMLTIMFSVANVVSFDVFASNTGTLSEEIIVKSNILKYDLGIRVYTPANYDKSEALPVVFVTDGQWFINPGGMTKVLDEEIATNKIQPVVTVFVDSRNPNDKKENRRNREFMCNSRYAEFYINELLPYTRANYNTSLKREDNVIMGMSFGGLNAGCFGAMAPDYFGGLGMLSPANSKMLRELRKIYRKGKPRKSKVFLSFGTINDNILEGRRLKSTLTHLDFDINYFEVNEGHDWNNWRPLLDDLLKTFFATEKQS